MIRRAGVGCSVRSWARKATTVFIRPVYHRIYRAGIRLACLLASLTDHFRIQASGFADLPPPLLRYRVGETVSLAAFLKIGREAATNLTGALMRSGHPFESFPRVLDFGCGCGRTLIWLLRDFPQQAFSGTDVDPQAIAWCRQNLDSQGFTTNSPLPPLPYPEDSFDLVYALSVFTHLDQASQSRWLGELRRVLKAGGVLLVTVHGARVWERLDAGKVEQIREVGHLETGASRLKGICPDWYRTSFHSQEFVVQMFGRYFEEVDYYPEAMGYQDVVICRALGPAGNG